MSDMTYLPSSRVTAVKETTPPQNRSRTGYGNKLPTSWLLQLDGKRWHRVYVVQWSNAGSAYICEKSGVKGKLWLGAFLPQHFQK